MGQIKDVEVYNKAVSLDAAQNTPIDITSEMMPKGLIHGFTLRIKNTDLTGLGAAASDYPKVVRSITYGAAWPKHNVMVGMPGKRWDKIVTTLNRKAPKRVTPTTAGFEINYLLPFSFRGADRFPMRRPNDSGLLNIGGLAQPFVTLALGPKGDIGTTITGNPSVRVILIAHFEPNPKPGFLIPSDPLGSGDQPSRMLEILWKQHSGLTTDSVLQLTKGGTRDNYMGFLVEVTDAGVDATDIFNMGVAQASKFEIINGDSDNYSPRVKLETQDSLMEDYFGIALPSSFHAWVAAKQGRLSDVINTRAGEAFHADFDNLATTASRVLESVQIGSLDIPKAIMEEHTRLLTPK